MEHLMLFISLSVHTQYKHYEEATDQLKNWRNRKCSNSHIKHIGRIRAYQCTPLSLKLYHNDFKSV
jgi:hypothetical protein